MAERFLEHARVADVRKLIVGEAATIGPEAEIPELLEKILEDPRSRHVYVVDESGVLVGSVRLNSVIQYLFPYTTTSVSEPFPSASRLLAQLAACKVRDIMNPTPQFVDDSTRVPHAVRIMWDERINELPVVDQQKRVVGELNLLEIIAAYLEKT